MWVIVERRFHGKAEFVVREDVLVPPLPKEEAIRLIVEHIRKDVALYKKEALLSLVAGEPTYLRDGWILGFRRMPDNYKRHLDFVIGPSNGRRGVLHRLFVIPRIHEDYAEGFVQVIGAWIARAETVKRNGF